MNQELIKEIAGINREYLEYLITLIRTYSTKLNKNSAPSKARAVEVCYNRFKVNIQKQSELFEREQKEIPYITQPDNRFNPSQFKKECGVDTKRVLK